MFLAVPLHKRQKNYEEGIDIAVEVSSCELRIKNYISFEIRHFFG
jgi:hypothetical protein